MESIFLVIGKQARAYKREVNTAIEWKILKEWAFVGTKMTHGTFKLTINSPAQPYILSSSYLVLVHQKQHLDNKFTLK